MNEPRDRAKVETTVPVVGVKARELLAAATPRPWANQGYDETEDATFILGGGVPMSAEEHQVALTLSPKMGADAALIVLAVNEYEALLDIAEAVEEYVMQEAGWNEARYAALVDALARRDALTQATLSPPASPASTGLSDSDRSGGRE